MEGDEQYEDEQDEELIVRRSGNAFRIEFMTIRAAVSRGSQMFVHRSSSDFALLPHLTQEKPENEFLVFDMTTGVSLQIPAPDLYGALAYATLQKMVDPKNNKEMQRLLVELEIRNAVKKKKRRVTFAPVESCWLESCGLES